MKNKKITEIITMLLNMHYKCKRVDAYIFDSGIRVNILFNNDINIPSLACCKHITHYEDIGIIVDTLIKEIDKSLFDLYKKELNSYYER